jgi:hypothetical protein
MRKMLIIYKIDDLVDIECIIEVRSTSTTKIFMISKPPRFQMNLNEGFSDISIFLSISGENLRWAVHIKSTINSHLSLLMDDFKAISVIVQGFYVKVT